MSKFSVPDPDADNQNVQQAPVSKFAVPVPEDDQSVPKKNYVVPEGQTWETAGGNVIPSENSQKGNWFLDMVENFNRPFGRMAEGVMDLGASIGSNLGGGQEAQQFKQELGQYNQSMEQSAQEAADRSPTASLVGSVLGNVGAGAAYGGPAISSAASIPMKMAAGAVSGSAMGFMDYAPDMSTRIGKGIAGGVIGGTIPLAIGGAKSIKKMLTPNHSESGFLKSVFKPKEAVVDDMASTIKGQFKSSDDAITSVQQAKELMETSGVKITPGEAFPDTVGVDEAAMSIDKAQKNKQVNPFFFEQQGKAKENLLDVVEGMSKAESKLKVDKLFSDDLGKQFIDADGKLSKSPTLYNDGITSGQYIKPRVIEDNAILSSEFDKVLKNSEYSKMPQGSIAQLHKVKTNIEEDIYSANSKVPGDNIKGIDRSKLVELEAARNEISKVLNQSPEYQQAMKLAQGRIIQKQYEEVIGRKATKAGDISVLELRQALLNKGKTRDQFIKDVIETGGDPKKAETVIDVIDTLSKSPLERVVKNSIQKDPSKQYLGGRIVAIGQSVIDKLTDGAYTKAALKLSLDPKWTDEIIGALQKTKKEEQLKAVADIMKPFFQQFYKEAKQQIGAGVQRGASLRGSSVAEWFKAP